MNWTALKLFVSYVRIFIVNNDDVYKICLSCYDDYLLKI